MFLWLFCGAPVLGRRRSAVPKGHPDKILTGRNHLFLSLFSLSLSISLPSLLYLSLSLSISLLSLFSLSLSLSLLSLSLSLSLCVDGNLTVKSSNLLFMTNPIVQSRELGSIAKLWGESANSDGREASVQKGTFSLHVCRISCAHSNTWVLKSLTRSFKETKAWTSNTLGHMFLLDNLCLFTGCVWKVPRNVLNF